MFWLGVLVGVVVCVVLAVCVAALYVRSATRDPWIRF